MSKDQQKTQKGQAIPTFTEDEARAYFESQRWPDGAVCAHCGSKQCAPMGGNPTREGLYHCSACRGQFTVTVGTVMEDSHLPLSKWALAFHFMASSKKGMSALQLQRNLGLGSYRTAWHLAHRIREAMKPEESEATLLKGNVEVDEAYIGGKPRHGDGKVHKRGRGTSKAPVMVLVERNGKAISRHLTKVDANNLQMEIIENVNPSATIQTDENPSYNGIGKRFEGGHQTVNHSQKIYKLGNACTNTAESYFAIMKRGVYGTFHSISKKHLHRYCVEFDFRWNGRAVTDTQRRDIAVKGAEGKRLTYRAPIGRVRG
ncbi:MAG: IS1595 family transposase [Verrucomicrobiota bacterium]